MGETSMDYRRIILHLDMDSFYASVEMRENPALKGKPVVIGADPRNGTGRGVVSTCSYEARAFGIRSAMPISQAFVLCPHALFIPPHFPRYAKASDDVMAILKSHALPFQQVSIDEAFLDVSVLGDTWKQLSLQPGSGTISGRSWDLPAPLVSHRQKW